MKKNIKKKLSLKIVFSLAIMGVALTVATSVFSFETAKSYLESTYAERVVTTSTAIADMLSAEDVKTIISEGGDQTEEYKEMVTLFNKLKKDGNVTFLSLVVPDEDSVTFYIDSMVEEIGDDPANQLAYGTDVLYKDAANPDDPDDYQKYITIWELYKQNKGTNPPLVTDNDYGYNYTCVSVICDETGEAIAEIQYILDMSSVRSNLYSFLNKMIIISLGIVTLAIVAYIFYVRKTVTKPIGELSEFTLDITNSKDFESKRITLETGDEIQSLAESFNFMLGKIEDYIENLSKITAEKERIGAELDIASHIQTSMLPCIFPAFPERDEFTIFATMDPAKEVGGDFYDFFMVDEKHIAIVMADVSGKGVPAALFMVIGKTLIKDHTEPDKDLGEVFGKVNNILCESNSEGLFITAFEGVLNLETGEFNYVNAGHERPFILSNGTFEEYKIKPGFVLAGMEDMHYTAGKTSIKPGDKIFLYTDGVPEATNSNSELYGMERLNKVLNNVQNENAETILAKVKEDVDAFVGEADQFDDLTMLCLEYKKKMGGSDNEITVDATIENIDKIMAFAEEKLESFNASMKSKTQLDIAIDEIYSNIARYAYGSEIGKATVEIEHDEKENMAILTFIDSGVAYNPLEKADPDVTLSADERQIGGLGIFLVKNTMDDMTYEYKDGKNILQIKKKL